jgi:excisionase family DNA binding protein
MRTQPANISPQPDSGEVPAKLLLTVADAARALSLSRTTIYELFASGELRSVRIGRARRIPVDALHDYAARVSLEVE